MPTIESTGVRRAFDFENDDTDPFNDRATWGKDEPPLVPQASARPRDSLFDMPPLAAAAAPTCYPDEVDDDGSERPVPPIRTATPAPAPEPPSSRPLPRAPYWWELPVILGMAAGLVAFLATLALLGKI